MPNRVIIKGKIGNALESQAEDHILGVANDIFDESSQEYQSKINAGVVRADKDQSLTDEQKAKALENQGVVIAQGSDFTNPDAVKRAKVPTVGAVLDGLNDGIYDVSKRNPTAGPNSDGKFTLEYILSNADTLIPTGFRHGGMIISFVDTYDNKYVQYMYTGTSTANADFTNITYWEKVNLEEELGNLEKEVLSPVSTNLYNKNDVDCVNYKYVNDLDGELLDSQLQKASGWVPVKPNTYYIGGTGTQMAWYTRDKVYISGESRFNSAVLSPATAAFARFSFYMESDSTNQLNEGQTLLPYEAWSSEKMLNPEALVNEKNIKSINNISIVGKGKATLIIPASDIPINSSSFGILVDTNDVQSAFGKTDNLLSDFLTFVSSTNLYNKNDADCVNNKYVVSNTGELADSQLQKASGYIPVKPNTYYIGYKCSQAAFYDSNKAYISGVANISTSSAQSPATAAYIRVSFYMADEGENRLNEGQTLFPYQKYFESYYAFNSKELDKAYNLVGTLRDENTASSMSNGGRIAINTAPKDATGGIISFFAKLTSFGNGVLVGKKEATSSVSNSWVEIDSTYIKCFYNDSGNKTQIGSSIAHGLTFSDFIKVSIVISVNKWKVFVSTKATENENYGVFVTEFENAFHRGTPCAESLGASLTDIDLTFNCNDIKKPIWAFGDSYFGSRSANRVMYWLNSWGYADKIMVNGFGGRASTEALSDLLRCINFGMPKMIVWCLGMNDNQSTIATWQDNLTQVKNICDENRIELVVATIPPVLSQSYINKDTMNQYLIDNGFRLLDVAKAVGAQSNGQWYGYGTDYDYQAADNVHPSNYGAKAIAAQWLVDVPEITQY